jgi:hypothetical protein
MRICYDPEVDPVYARVAEPTGPARTEVLESGVAVERSAEADGGAYGFEFIMVKSRGLPTIDLPSDVALAIEEFVASGALESRDEQQQITPTRLLLSPPNQQDDRRSLGPQQRASGPLNLVSVGIAHRRAAPVRRWAEWPRSRSRLPNPQRTAWSGHVPCCVEPSPRMVRAQSRWRPRPNRGDRTLTGPEDVVFGAVGPCSLWSLAALCGVGSGAARRSGRSLR